MEKKNVNLGNNIVGAVAVSRCSFQVGRGGDKPNAAESFHAIQMVAKCRHNVGIADSLCRIPITIIPHWGGEASLSYFQQKSFSLFDPFPTTPSSVSLASQAEIYQKRFILTQSFNSAPLVYSSWLTRWGSRSRYSVTVFTNFFCV